MAKQSSEAFQEVSEVSFESPIFQTLSPLPCSLLMLCPFFPFSLSSRELTSCEVDLVGVDLMEVVLVGVDLVGVDLVGVDHVGGHRSCLDCFCSILVASFPGLHRAWKLGEALGTSLRFWLSHDLFHTLIASWSDQYHVAPAPFRLSHDLFHRCRVKVALRHTYITLPQAASHIAGLRTRFKLGQEGKIKVFVTF